MRIDVFNWTKNPFTEQSIAFWFLRTIIDRFRLCYLAVAPLQNIFRARHRQANCVEISDTMRVNWIRHLTPPPYLLALLFRRTFRLPLRLYPKSDLHRQ